MSDFVKALYAANPNAIKAPAEADVQWWDTFRAQHGDTVTTNTFNAAVAQVTGTPVWSAASAVTSRAWVLPLVLVAVAAFLFLRRRKK